MPLYDYFCEANGRTVEVRHGMAETVKTWGDLCARAGIEPEGTPGSARVIRKLTAAVPLTDRSARVPASEGPPPCGPTCGCAWDA